LFEHGGRYDRSGIAWHSAGDGRRVDKTSGGNSASTQFNANANEMMQPPPNIDVEVSSTSFLPQSLLEHLLIKTQTMPTDEKESNIGRRSGKDRRGGVDTRTEEGKRLVGERRSTIERRSGRDRRFADRVRR
jgi:hypothetical protein